MGSGVCTNAPSSLLPLLFSLPLSPSLDSFSDMPAQAHLAAHALPLHFPYLPPPFTFLPCGISMATWKETSVLGEQCDGVGCFGWEGVFRVEGAEDKGSRGIQYAHPGRPGHRYAGNSDNRPLRAGSECEGDGNGVGCCHTMSNQYELPRAVGPQRHISSKVALNTEMVAALKFTSVHRLETHTYGSILRQFVWCSL